MSTSAPLIDQLTMQLRAQRLLLATQLRQRLHGGDNQQELALSNYFAAQDDAAEASQLSDIDVAQLGHELSELKAIDLALHRIASGSFGSCACCGEAIAPERLLAQPYASLCLSCQKASELHLTGARSASRA